MSNVTGPDQVVLLGAAPAVRGNIPAALMGTGASGRVLDWLIKAFEPLDDAPIALVVGFKAEAFLTEYPQLHVVVNHEWATTGAVDSLAAVPLQAPGSTYVSYADVVFRADTVARLRDTPGDVVVAVDSQWRHRYEGRSRQAVRKAEKVEHSPDRVTNIGAGISLARASAEFAGVFRFSQSAADTVKTFLRSSDRSPRATIPDLLQYCIAAGLHVAPVDVGGNWAELDARQDLARFVLGTKAESLERLRTMPHGGHIGKQVTFTQLEWRTETDAIAERIINEFDNQEVIVRSSALSEDTWDESGAGRHESVLNVAPDDDQIRVAVERVLSSYDTSNDANQVLVQSMLRDVAMSGVCMTRTHALGAPYYVLNYDDATSRTDTVTAGQDARTVMLLRGDHQITADPALAPVVEVMKKLEALVGHDALDIEFATTREGLVHVLQVRPIAIDHLQSTVNDDEVATAITSAQRWLDSPASTTTLLGSDRYYSVMTDWNPAEIVGTKPRRLAFSLYRYLITDDIWAQQRAEYGYRDVRPCPLLVDIAGHPYVDVRASFNSFIPMDLSASLALRLVDHYSAALLRDPTLHDKVEFDIVFTCLTPDFDSRSERLRASGFTGDDINALRDALAAITNRGVKRVEHATQLMHRLKDLQAADHSVVGAPLDRALLHLERARTHGTLTFSHLARSAFVATDILRGLVAEGVLSHERHAEFLSTIETVFGRFQSDATKVRMQTLNINEFINVYGHLRPGTYDIASPTYRSRPDLYLIPAIEAADSGRTPIHFEWTGPERHGVNSKFAACGLDFDLDTFDTFARLSIAGREEAKFVFTASLSAALEAIAEWGELLGRDRESLSHLCVSDILQCRDALGHPSKFIDERIAEGRHASALMQAMCVPGQLHSAQQLISFEQPAAEANFITQKTAEAKVINVATDPLASVEGAIVLIPSADPGYDGLLARGIAGLITMFGGANSHMAVRSAETGIPAAIGVGEQRFAQLAKASVIRLECATRRIAVVA